MDAPINIENLGLIWARSSGDSYNAVPRKYPAFLSDEQKAKIERIRQGRMLYNGRHRDYFLGENRSQFDFPPTRVGDWVHQPYLMSNAIKLVCNKTADLLFGAEPEIGLNSEAAEYAASKGDGRRLAAENKAMNLVSRASGNAAQDKAFADLRERSGLDRLFYAACLSATYEEEAFVEACIENEKTYLKKLPADETFCIGEMGPDLQFPQYDRYRMKNVGTVQKEIWLLLIVSYKVGRIERTLWQLDDKMQKMRQLDLKNWVAPFGQAMQPGALIPEALTLTGLDENTVTWIPCELCDGRPVGRIDGLIDLQDALNAKETQIGRVIAKHADPKIAVTRDMADSKGNVRSDMDVFFVDDMGRAPAYVVWNAQLDAAMKSAGVVLNRLLILAEISPSLLGLKEGAAPDAARKLRLEATNTLAMVARIGAYWKPAMKRAMTLALMLEGTIKGNRYSEGTISIAMKDGLPIDTLDQATESATWRAAGLMSVEDGVAVRIPDPEEREAEVERINKEAAAKVPSVFMGDMSGSGETLPQDKIPTAETEPTKSDGSAA